MEWRSAAVVLAIFADAPHGVVFIERAAHLRRHASQIGLPGGVADAADGGDPVVTALREMREEVGVGPDLVRVVGRLPEVRHTVNHLAVTPLVAVLDPGAPLTIDHTETVGVFTVPLESIVEAGAIREDAVRSSALGKVIYAFAHEERDIWGLTARILASFAELWNEPESKLRAAIESLLQ